MVTYDPKSVGQIIKSHVHTVKASYTLIPASSLYHCILCILPTEGKILCFFGFSTQACMQKCFVFFLTSCIKYLYYEVQICG